MAFRVPTRLQDNRGFTLIELLVVILIIGILAAIALPSFLNQRSKAQDVEAKTHAVTVATTMFTYEQEAGTFATANAAALIAIEPSIADARNLVVTGTRDTFEISVDSASAGSGGGSFRIEYDAGRTVRPCDAPGQGGCPSGGTW